MPDAPSDADLERLLDEHDPAAQVAAAEEATDGE